VQKIINCDRGIYILEIHLSHTFSLELKTFHHIKFPKGFYYYVGSAQKNLTKRIERHLNKNKKLFWHIDYITSLPFTKISGITIFPDAQKEIECELVNYLSNNYELNFPVKKFGSSDCHRCYSHLLYSNKKINFILKDMKFPRISYYPKIIPR
jgi:Uri superfamily endonuclease